MAKELLLYRRRKGFTLFFVMILSFVIILMASFILTLMGSLSNTVSSVDSFYRESLVAYTISQRVNTGYWALPPYGTTNSGNITLNGMQVSYTYRTYAYSPNRFYKASIGVIGPNFSFTIHSTGLAPNRLFNDYVRVNGK
ncbi:MAG: hypothetical protein QXP36_02445 [Conexivisphaerales archaeon]